MRPSLLALALAGATACACAQPARAPGKSDLPVPPPLRTQGLVPVEVAGTSMRFGVDPASVSVGADSTVRYVIVATSPSGVVNAMYEGLRCGSAEVAVLAYHNPDSGWSAVAEPKWQPLRNNPPVRHSLAVAQGGACLGDAPNGSAVQIVQDLKAPVDRRYERGGSNR